MKRLKIFLSLLLIVILLLTACEQKSVQIDKTVDAVNAEQDILSTIDQSAKTETIADLDANPKVETLQDNTSKNKKDVSEWKTLFLPETVLTFEKSMEWMIYVRTLYPNNLVHLPEFKLNEKIDDENLSVYILIHLLDHFFYNENMKSRKDEVMEEAYYAPLKMDIGRIKEGIIEKEALRIFNQKIQKHELKHDLLVYEKGYYWIIPFGDEGPITVLVPRIIHFEEKSSDVIELEIEFYQHHEYEPISLENVQDLSVENFYGKLNENTRFKGTAFKKNKMTLKKVVSDNTERWVVIENMPLDK